MRLVDHQVLQRTTPDGVELDLGPTPDSVLVDGDARSAGRTLVLPTGGPYRVEVRWPDWTMVAEDVLVGDLWLMAGQSNMEGCGRLDEELQPPHPLVHVHDPQGRWRLAEEPLHRQDLAMFCTEPEDANGAGLGLAFATALVERTGVPVGLVATAVSATSTDHWDPTADEGLWQRMLDLTGRAGGALAGVLWYQGESEAEPGRQAGYADALDGIARAFRDRFGEDCRLLHVQVGRLLAGHWTPPESRTDKEWSHVRAVQLACSSFDALVPAVDADMTDLIHLSTAGLRRVGRRLALAADPAREPLRPSRVEVDGTTALMTVTGAAGGLRPGDVRGFVLLDAGGTAHSCPARSTDPLTIAVQLPRAPGTGDALYYGWGMDPVCDVTDLDDMALPACGPFALA